MQSFETNYIQILQSLLEGGDVDIKPVKGFKNIHCLSKNGLVFSIDNSVNFPLISSRKIFYKKAFTEMVWFIKGSTITQPDTGEVFLDLTELNIQGCTYWNAWGLQHLQNNRDEWSKYFPIPNTNIDFPKNIKEFTIAIKYLSERIYLKLGYSNISKVNIMENSSYYTIPNIVTVNQSRLAIDRIKANKYDRRAMVNYWRVEDLEETACDLDRQPVNLPPCHFNHQLLATDKHLDLTISMRSWDMMLGLPYNIAQYALLHRMYAKCLNLCPRKLVFLASDYHIYSNQIPSVKKLIDQYYKRISKKSQTEEISCYIKPRNQSYLEDFEMGDIVISNYNPEKVINIPLTAVIY